MTTELGHYLRARRAAVDPRAAGLPATGTRRVAGLRREEVAVRAAVSADYYARLEQGRERRPSPQVLDALAGALDLDLDARDHLYALAGLRAPRRGSRRAPVADPELLRLLEAWPRTPAFVLSSALDVLAANALARALFDSLPLADNLARAVFLDPAADAFYPEWDRVAAATVSSLRAATATDPRDPTLEALIVELGAGSPAFRDLWARQDVEVKRRDTKRFAHPDVGPLALTFQVFDVRSAPGQQLVVYQAEPGSPSEQGLLLLGSLAASLP